MVTGGQFKPNQMKPRRSSLKCRIYFLPHQSFLVSESETLRRVFQSDFPAFSLAIQSEIAASTNLKTRQSQDQSASTKTLSTNEMLLGSTFTKINEIYGIHENFRKFENFGDFDTFLLVYNIHVPLCFGHS